MQGRHCCYTLTVGACRDMFNDGHTYLLFYHTPEYALETLNIAIFSRMKAERHWPFRYYLERLHRSWQKQRIALLLQSKQRIDQMLVSLIIGPFWDVIEKVINCIDTRKNRNLADYNHRRQSNLIYYFS